MTLGFTVAIVIAVLVVGLLAWGLCAIASESDAALEAHMHDEQEAPRRPPVAPYDLGSVEGIEEMARDLPEKAASMIVSMSAEIVALRDALAEAADDLDKAANQFAGLAPPRRGALAVVGNPEIFAAKARRAREVLGL